MDRTRKHSADDDTERHGDERPDDPKRTPDPSSNTQKPADAWVSGDDPMTGAQASYLRTLSEEAHDLEQFAPDLSKAEASRRIDALRKRLGRE